MPVTNHYKTITVPDAGAYVALQMAIRMYAGALVRSADPANDTDGHEAICIEEARRALAAVEAVSGEVEFKA